MLIHLYEFEIWFDGRRVEENREPPAHFVHTLVQTIVRSMVLREDVINHKCKAECALNSYLVLGFPYADDLVSAVPRYFIYKLGQK